MSKIEWTDVTWNPVTGCTKISEGCRNCYAERMAKRLQAMGQPKYKNGFEVTLHHDEWNKPAGWKKPRNVFVCSMSDLFHKNVPYQFIHNLFFVMRSCPQHIFQVLTKRAGIMCGINLVWPKNALAGVTIELDKYSDRADMLRQTPCHHRFLSLEPLLGPLPNLTLENIDWVIAGGESGPGARPMHPDWVRDIRDQCLAQNIPFFFKQWGGVNKKKTGRLLDGRTWDEMPRGLR